MLQKYRVDDVGWGSVLRAVKDTHRELHLVTDIDGPTSDSEWVFALVSCKNVNFFGCVSFAT